MERKAALPTFQGHLLGNPEAPTKKLNSIPSTPLKKAGLFASGQQLSLIRDVKSYHWGLEMPPCQGSQPPTTDFWGWIKSLWGFPGGSDGKESTCNAGDQGSRPGLGRSAGERNSNPFQYSCLENSMDRGA